MFKIVSHEVLHELRVIITNVPTRDWIDFRVFEEKPVAWVGDFTFCIEGERGKHKAAHFHIRIGKDRLASIGIQDGIPFHSKFSAQTNEAIRKWTIRHKLCLMAAWNAVYKGGNPVSIKCSDLDCECIDCELKKPDPGNS